MFSRILRTPKKIKFIIFVACMCFMKPKKNNNIDSTPNTNSEICGNYKD